MVIISGEKATMKLIAFVSLIIFAACNKGGSAEHTTCPEGKGAIEGTWKMSEVRADPGDGSGKFLPTDLDLTITFDGDGHYANSRDAAFNRYVSVATDTVKLFNSETGLSKLIAIKELDANTLMYFTNWPWCGGPYGEKFNRVK